MLQNGDAVTMEYIYELVCMYVCIYMNSYAISKIRIYFIKIFNDIQYCAASLR